MNLKSGRIAGVLSCANGANYDSYDSVSVYPVQWHAEKSLLQMKLPVGFHGLECDLGKCS